MLNFKATPEDVENLKILYDYMGDKYLGELIQKV
jgi:hypothetical protein